MCHQLPTIIWATISFNLNQVSKIETFKAWSATTRASLSANINLTCGRRHQEMLDASQVLRGANAGWYGPGKQAPACFIQRVNNSSKAACSVLVAIKKASKLDSFIKLRLYGAVLNENMINRTSESYWRFYAGNGENAFVFVLKIIMRYLATQFRYWIRWKHVCGM